jgi:hypothetical protein
MKLLYPAAVIAGLFLHVDNYANNRPPDYVTRTYRMPGGDLYYVGLQNGGTSVSVLFEVSAERKTKLLRDIRHAVEELAEARAMAAANSNPDAAEDVKQQHQARKAAAQRRVAELQKKIKAMEAERGDVGPVREIFDLRELSAVAVWDVRPEDAEDDPAETTENTEGRGSEASVWLIERPATADTEAQWYCGLAGGVYYWATEAALAVKFADRESAEAMLGAAADPTAIATEHLFVEAAPETTEGTEGTEGQPSWAPLAPGDVVFGDGRFMTLEEIEPGDLWTVGKCLWFEGAELHSGSFPMSELRRATSEEIAKIHSATISGGASTGVQDLQRGQAEAEDTEDTEGTEGTEGTEAEIHPSQAPAVPPNREPLPPLPSNGATNKQWLEYAASIGFEIDPATKRPELIAAIKRHVAESQQGGSQ